MATNFPASLDTFTNPTATSDTATIDHAGQHANANDSIAALQARVGITSSAVTSSHDYLIKSAVNPGHTHTGIGPHLFVAASNATAAEKARADYSCTGSNDDVQIQAAITALPANGGMVELSSGTFTTAATINIIRASVALIGQGIGVTIISAPNTVHGIRIGNRQSDSIMRNNVQLRDMTVNLAGGASTKACVLIDGGGYGTGCARVQTNQGNYGFELMDLDRNVFIDCQANNPRTACFFLEVGLENTYGTVTFINPYGALSDNSSSVFLCDANADQAGANRIDRIGIYGCLFYSSVGLTGTCGIKMNVGASSMVVQNSLFENPIHHIDLYGQTDLQLISCTFLQNSGVSSNCVRMNTNHHYVTSLSCRYQQATNVFNNASGNSDLCVLGLNENQGTITNLFTGSFASKQGTDANFIGGGVLAFGTNAHPIDYVFMNKPSIPEVSNGRMGVATLVGGTVTVSNSSVQSGHRIFLSRATTGGTTGHLSYTISAGASFTITSTSATETSTVNWLIIEPS
jgi:hypothetical protein